MEFRRISASAVRMCGARVDTPSSITPSPTPVWRNHTARPSPRFAGGSEVASFPRHAARSSSLVREGGAPGDAAEATNGRARPRPRHRADAGPRSSADHREQCRRSGRARRRGAASARPGRAHRRRRHARPRVLDEASRRRSPRRTERRRQFLPFPVSNSKWRRPLPAEVTCSRRTAGAYSVAAIAGAGRYRRRARRCLVELVFMSPMKW